MRILVDTHTHTIASDHAYSTILENVAAAARAGLEALLGFEKEGARIRLRPTAPADWEGFTVEYRFGTSRYVLRAARGGGDDGWAELVDDDRVHTYKYVIKICD